LSLHTSILSLDASILSLDASILRLYASILSLYASTLSLHASILSAYGPPWLHFEPVQLMNFGDDADPDPAAQDNSDPDPSSQNNVEKDWHFPAIFHAQKSRKLPLAGSQSRSIFECGL
jgi:hypothetical protein